MATKIRKHLAPLDILLERPKAFDFFQAVRLLKIAFAKNNKSIEQDNDFDSLRFHAAYKSSFASGFIDSIECKSLAPEITEESLFHLYVTFLGLTGPSGILPQHYNELILKKIHEKNTVLSDFFDIFNHKIISLLYKVWEKNFLPAVYENHINDKKTQNFYSRVLMSVSGFGLNSSRDCFTFSNEVIQYYSGLLSHRIHSAKTLGAILSDYFELPIHVIQFQKQWLYLSKKERSRLCSKESLDDNYNALSKNILLGEKHSCISSKFRIYIGPLNDQQFNLLAPNGALINAIKELVQLYIKYEFNFDFQIELLAEDMPFCKLSSKMSMRLGWSTWLLSKKSSQNSSQIIIHNNQL